MGMFSSSFSTAWGIYFNALQSTNARQIVHSSQLGNSLGKYTFCLFIYWKLHLVQVNVHTQGRPSCRGGTSCWSCHHGPWWFCGHARVACPPSGHPQIQTSFSLSTAWPATAAIFSLWNCFGARKIKTWVTYENIYAVSTANSTGYMNANWGWLNVYRPFSWSFSSDMKSGMEAGGGTPGGMPPGTPL